MCPFVDEAEAVRLEPVVRHLRARGARSPPTSIGTPSANSRMRKTCSNMSGQPPSRDREVGEPLRPPGGAISSGFTAVAPGPGSAPHTHGTRSPQWSRWKCVIAIASMSGQSSCSRRRASTPGPQSSSRSVPVPPRADSPTGRRPDWATRASTRRRSASPHASYARHAARPYTPAMAEAPSSCSAGSRCSPT